MSIPRVLFSSSSLLLSPAWRIGLFSVGLSPLTPPWRPFLPPPVFPALKTQPIAYPLYPLLHPHWMDLINVAVVKMISIYPFAPLPLRVSRMGGLFPLSLKPPVAITGTLVVVATTTLAVPKQRLDLWRWKKWPFWRYRSRLGRNLERYHCVKV